jgi:hypothetical protein
VAQKRISAAQSWIETRGDFDILSDFPQLCSKIDPKVNIFQNAAQRPIWVGLLCPKVWLLTSLFSIKVALEGRLAPLGLVIDCPAGLLILLVCGSRALQGCQWKSENILA